MPINLNYSSGGRKRDRRVCLKHAFNLPKESGIDLSEIYIISKFI